MTHDGTKLFALRVFNIPRSCILIKQFDNDVWTMPVLSIPYKEDPMHYLDSILEQVETSTDFKFVSAVSILENVLTEKDVEHHSIIYDLRYTGKVLPNITRYDKRYYKLSKWHPKGSVKYLKPLNYPTAALVQAAEKESCLR